jgi:hypothetical protein
MDREIFINIAIIQVSRKLIRVGTKTQLSMPSKYQCTKCGATQSFENRSQCPNGGYCIWKKISRSIKSVFLGLNIYM